MISKHTREHQNQPASPTSVQRSSPLSNSAFMLIMLFFDQFFSKSYFFPHFESKLNLLR